MKRAFVLSALGLLALPARAVASPIDVLTPFIGSWESSGTFVDSAYSKAGTVSGTTSCAWSMGHDFVICQQRTALGGNEEHGLAIYTYDAAAQLYRFYNVGFSRVGSMVIAADATTVTYTDKFSDEGKNVTARTVNIWDGPDRYHFRSDYSMDDGAHWTTILTGTANRAPKA